MAKPADMIRRLLRLLAVCEVMNKTIAEVNVEENGMEKKKMTGVQVLFDIFS